MKVLYRGKEYLDIENVELGEVGDEDCDPYQFIYLVRDGKPNIELESESEEMTDTLHIEYPEWQLVRFECNWADEIDVDEIGVMTGEEFTNYVTRIKQSKFYPVRVSIGSNQQIEFNKADDVRFNSVPVSDEFALSFKTLCPYGGSLKTFYRIAEYLQDKELYP